MVREPVNAETGTYEALRVDAVDPAASVEPATGHKPFLVWKAEKNVDEIEEWVARGVDATTYRIKPQTAGTPPSATGIMEVD